MSKRSSSIRDDQIEEEDILKSIEEPSLQVSDDSGAESLYSGLNSEPDTSSSEDEIDDFDDEAEAGKLTAVVEDIGQTASWREADDTDTDDEEELRNTVGNIPLAWYEDYPHRGYDIDGRAITKPPTVDELDEFLAKMESPDYWRTVKDPVTGRDVVLTDEQLDLIKKIERSEFPEQTGDPYEPYTDHFTHEKQLFPLSSALKPKSSFAPSKWEQRKVSKLVQAIKAGRIQPRKPPHKPKFYDLWGQGDETTAGRHRMHIPAPRLKLPGHAESYNPPPEYLPTPQERDEWAGQDPEDRDKEYLPQQFDSLRQVPAYPRFIQERFERCLDLYLCPRQRRMRVQVEPEELLPKLPKPRDLQPFPTTLALEYKGHKGLVRCVSVEGVKGQWLASGGEDVTLRLWEVVSGRCMGVVTLEDTPTSLEFAPGQSRTLLAVAFGNSVEVVNHGLGDRLVVSATDKFIADLDLSSAESSAYSWSRKSTLNHEAIRISHNKPVKQVTWHNKGDYFATVSSDSSGSEVVIHQLSKSRSQTPFKKLKGSVQRVAFHPTKPFFFVATQTYVRVYNLAKQELIKKLLSGVKWISDMVVHPSGDHVLLSSYDKRVVWFDMDLSAKPYKTLRHHKQAIRSVCCHPRLPLFASASDDSSVVVCHGQVFNDLMQNPQIVPVKVLRGGPISNNMGVLDCVFHPVQPWLISAGADSIIRLFT
ncbi:ribosome biogenesis protein bop1-B-like isoform X2 [Halichondria panicea]|uniref:ribosome biogenesis protein bop1-B-like isoform X2 n=1 Tax=Halichondria panicea TaxID=6063 RepID=UPI00312B847F